MSGLFRCLAQDTPIPPTSNQGLDLPRGLCMGGSRPHPARIRLQGWEQRGVKRNKAGVKLLAGELQAESAFVATSGRLEEDPALSGSRLLLKPFDPLTSPLGAPCSSAADAPAATG